MKREINDKAHELGLKYFPNEQNIWARENIEAVYCSGACIAMAEWMQKKMIEKACKWLINIDFDDFHFRDCDETFNNDLFVDSFRKAMEE